VKGKRARAEAAADDRLRQARVAAARRCSPWTEIAPPVQRGRFFVDEEDRILVRYAGAVWERGSAGIISDRTPLLFAVGAQNIVDVFEPAPISGTWTEHVEREARRDARTRSAL
jgi:hypothetical protein